MNMFSGLAKASRLTRNGRPLTAMLTLHKALLAPSTPSKRKGTAPRSALTAVPRPSPGSFVAGHFSCTHGELDYKLYTPLGSSRRTLPIVVMLHGCTQNATDFALGTRMNDLADELGFSVLYPEQSRAASFGRCWNWHRPGDQERGKGEPAVIAALTRKVLREIEGDPSRVYVAGLSAGGAAAAIVGAAYPDLFVAVGVHSGMARGNVSSLGEAVLAMRHGSGVRGGAAKSPMLPSIVFQGGRDTTVYPCNADGFVDELRRVHVGPLTEQTQQGVAPGRDVTRTIYRDRSNVVMLEAWMVHGSGHGWSGGNPAGSYTDAAGPNASREMARFFLARRRANKSQNHRALSN